MGTPRSETDSAAGCNTWCCRGSPWALLLAATYTRLTRGAMLDVLSEDYIRTARSKGLRESQVVVRHGLRAR